MTDTPPLALPAFAPVPRLKDRSNGWKPQVQAAFIEALADTGSVVAACRRVGRSDNGAYQLRRQPGAEEFAAAWEAALDHGVRRIEDVAMDRALYGVEVPVYCFGNLVGSRTVYNDRLVMFMLRNRAPHRFAEGHARGLSALDKTRLAQLKEEWRREWLKEDREDEIAQTEEQLAQIGRMHHNWYTGMSPRARAAYRLFRRIEREDAGGGWMLEGPEAEEQAGAAEAEYEDVFAADPRSAIRREMEAGGWFVDEVLADDDEAKAEADRQTVARVRTLKDDGWG